MSEGAQVRRWRAPDVSAPAAEPTPRSPAHERGVLTADRLEKIEEQAREAGYRAGFEEGQRDADALKRAHAEQLTRLLESIAPQTVLLDDAYVEQTSQLVIAVARQLVRRELKREPGEVVRVVRDGLAVLPVAESAVRIFLNPDDVALVREMLMPDALERPIKLVEDVAMTPGGARLETDVSVVDASVEARIAAVATSVFGDERANGDAGLSPAVEP